MKIIAPIEMIGLRTHYQLYTYYYFAKKDYKLLKYAFYHIWYYFLYSLHIISKSKFYRLYWDYFSKINPSEEVMQELRRHVLCQKNELNCDYKDLIFIAYAPRSFLQFLEIEGSLIALEDMGDQRKTVVQVLKQRNVDKYACVESADYYLHKNAEKLLKLKKGKLIEKSKLDFIFDLLRQFVCLLFLSFVITVFSLFLTPLDSYLVFQYLLHSIIIILNFIPVFTLMLVLFGVLNSLRKSFFITGLFFIVMVEINRFKMSFRDDPFVFMDVKYAKEAAQMTNNYQLFVDKATFLIIVVFLIFIILLLLVKKHKLNHPVLRLTCVFFPVLIFSQSYHLLYQNSTIYESTWNDAFGNRWKEGDQFVARGFNYSFIRSYNSSYITEPENYDEKKAAEILSQYETIDMKNEEKVHVIAIMLEAYNDLSVLVPEGEIAQEVYHNFHEIQNTSYSGFLYTDIFAGGTIATERSFLSGYSSGYEYRFPSETYVSYFKSQGYYTEAMHPCFGWFYNRKNVNMVGFGFDNFDYHENKYESIIKDTPIEETFGGFLYDIDFFQQIIQGYEKNKDRNMPYFNFSVTYQNHGPYSSGRLTDAEYLKWHENYDIDTYNIVNNYLADIYKTDQALKVLYDYIQAEKEPIILVLFGDHNPYLGEENASFTMLGIDLDLGNEIGGCNYYQTPYLITANQAAKDTLKSDFHGRGETISPIFLMNEMFQVAGLNIGSPYSRYLNDLKQRMHVINPLYIKQDGVYILRDFYEDEEDLLKNFYYVEYFQQHGE